jgi:hypothetical protein
VTLVHQTLQAVFALLLAPAAWFGAETGLAGISAVTGILLLIGFRAVSRPKAIRAAKRKVQAQLLAIRIFRDDLGVVLRSQVRLFPALGRYMGNMVVPFLLLLLPFAILFGHLDARYGTRALRPGETAIVTAAGAINGSSLMGWSLEASNGIAVETRGVQVPERNEISWRIRAIEPGNHEIALVAGERRVTKPVSVGSGTSAPRRMRASFDSIFFASNEPPIPRASGLDRIEIRLPGRSYTRFGLHWIVIFLLVSSTVAFVLRKRFGVEF